MIYLWTDRRCWEAFDLTETAELEKRGISISSGASIGDRACIGDGARIGVWASIGKGARIGDGARIGGGASIGDGASIGEGARIGECAGIGDRALIGNGACVGYEARIGCEASIGDGEKPLIVRINGSRFPVSYWGEDRVDIGCTARSIEAWLTDYTSIAAKNDFTPAEIEEYRAYVEFIKALHNRNGRCVGTQEVRHEGLSDTSA